MVYYVTEGDEMYRTYGCNSLMCSEFGALPARPLQQDGGTRGFPADLGVKVNSPLRGGIIHWYGPCGCGALAVGRHEQTRVVSICHHTQTTRGFIMPHIAACKTV